ncbi:MAG: sigma-70 family RNA polymerase sigma factor [Anaerolineales bacterium]|nr:sigma-70 family RNA polymerase sigma factor [Anaerolineales bacterium]
MSHKNGPNSDALELFRIVNETLAESEFNSIIPNLVPILKRNLSLGRVDRILQQSFNRTLSSYLLRLARTYKLESDHLAALLGDDKQAQSDLWQDLVRLAYSYLGRKGIASYMAHDITNDAAQDTWHKIITGKAIYPYDVSFGAWSTRILYNRLKKTYTQNRDVLDQDKLLWLDSLPADVNETIGIRSAPHDAIDSRFNITIRHALSSLPDEQRQACILFYFYDLSAKEVAKELGCTAQAVNSRCYRACRNLKRYLLSSGLGLPDFLYSSHP